MSRVFNQDLKVVGAIVGGTILIVVVGTSLTSPQSPNSTERTSITNVQPAQEPPTPKRMFTEDQKEHARWIMGKASERAKVYEEAGSLVVECHEFIYPYDINSRLSWVRQVCDADAVLQGGNARSIFFYDPNGKKFAQADTLRGIRLLD